MVRRKLRTECVERYCLEIRISTKPMYKRRLSIKENFKEEHIGEIPILKSVIPRKNVKETMKSLAVLL